MFLKRGIVDGIFTQFINSCKPEIFFGSGFQDDGAIFAADELANIVEEFECIPFPGL